MRKVRTIKTMTDDEFTLAVMKSLADNLEVYNAKADERKKAQRKIVESWK